MQSAVIMCNVAMAGEDVNINAITQNTFLSPCAFIV